MLVGLGWLHLALLRAVMWLLKLPFAALFSTLKAMAALLGEEARRWAGLIVAGLLIYGLTRLVLWLTPGTPSLLAAVSLLGMIWLYALLRAIHYTWNNNLVKVRQRQMFRQLSGDVNRLGDRLGAEVVGTAARVAKGTPAEGVFRANREDKAKAAARAERERAEAEADAARRDDLAAMEPDPYETQPR